MFGNAPAFSSFSVDDVAAAREFYGGTLGIKVAEQPEGLAGNFLSVLKPA